jgi:hypothetical protein
VERLKSANVDGCAWCSWWWRRFFINCCWYRWTFRARSYRKLNQQEEKKEVLYDRDKIEWDGPLVIMVNSFPRLHQKFCAAIRIIKRIIGRVNKHMVKERCRMWSI